MLCFIQSGLHCLRKDLVELFLTDKFRLESPLGVTFGLGARLWAALLTEVLSLIKSSQLTATLKKIVPVWSSSQLFIPVLAWLSYDLLEDEPGLTTRNDWLKVLFRRHKCGSRPQPPLSSDSVSQCVLTGELEIKLIKTIMRAGKNQHESDEKRQSEQSFFFLWWTCPLNSLGIIAEIPRCFPEEKSRQTQPKQEAVVVRWRWGLVGTSG